jgi:hypothetical protein
MAHVQLEAVIIEVLLAIPDVVHNCKIHCHKADNIYQPPRTGGIQNFDLRMVSSRDVDEATSAVAGVVSGLAEPLCDCSAVLCARAARCEATV